MTPDELRALRERHGLGQKELAELVGVEAVTISRWERGSRPIPAWFEKLHGYALLANSGSRGPGRPPTAAEARKAEEAARREREQPIVCSIRFCPPGSNRPMDPLPFRPYLAQDERWDPRSKPVTRYVYDDGEAVPGQPGTIPGVTKQGWCQMAFMDCREALEAQLVAMGHPPADVRLYRVEAGAIWSWRGVETSRPECIVTPAAMQRLTAVS